MEHILEAKTQFSKKCKDGRYRNFLIYFIDGVQILKQKIPYNERYEKGFDRLTGITNEYILNGKLYQTRYKHNGCGSKASDIREVKYPLSKKKLQELNVLTYEFIKISD